MTSQTYVGKICVHVNPMGLLKCILNEMTYVSHIQGVYVPRRQDFEIKDFSRDPRLLWLPGDTGSKMAVIFVIPRSKTQFEMWDAQGLWLDFQLFVYL